MNKLDLKDEKTIKRKAVITTLVAEATFIAYLGMFLYWFIR